MPTKKKELVFFYYRGSIERVSGKPMHYRWFNGYSERAPDGGVLYPWMTKKECMAEARGAGFRAVFIEETRARSSNLPVHPAVAEES